MRLDQLLLLVVAMEWNPVLEDRLHRAKFNRSYRWVGYIGLTVGIFLTAYMWVVYVLISGNSTWFLIPGAALSALSLAVALAGERAATQARELEVQRRSAQPSRFTSGIPDEQQA